MGLDKSGGIKSSNIWSVFFVPSIFLGLVLYVVATVLWFFILSRMKFSVAYPLQSLSYVFGLFAATIVFKEPISSIKWMGILLVVAGVICIANDSGN